MGTANAVARAAAVAAPNARTKEGAGSERRRRPRLALRPRRRRRGRRWRGRPPGRRLPPPPTHDKALSPPPPPPTENAATEASRNTGAQRVGWADEGATKDDLRLLPPRARSPPVAGASAGAAWSGAGTSGATRAPRGCATYARIVAALLLLHSAAIVGCMPGGAGAAGAPENVTVVFFNATTVCVSWMAPDRADKYDVTYKPTDASYRVVALVAGNLRAVTLHNLSADTQYQLFVTAVRQGKKARSPTVVFNTAELPTAAPTSTLSAETAVGAAQGPSSGAAAEVTASVSASRTNPHAGGRQGAFTGTHGESVADGSGAGEAVSSAAAGASATAADGEGDAEAEDGVEGGERKGSGRGLHVRGVEVGIVLLVLVVWIAAIVLFFNRWGKIRMLLPYQPDYKEQLKVPGSAATSGGVSCTGQHQSGQACPQNKNDLSITAKLKAACCFKHFHWASHDSWASGRPTRPRVNSAIYISTATRDADFIRHHQSFPSNLCRRSRSAENIPLSGLCEGYREGLPILSVSQASPPDAPDVQLEEEEEEENL